MPATIRSRSVFSSRSSSSGLTTKLPSILPIRTAPTGVGNGMSDTISAAEAPFIARMSYGLTWSTESGIDDELRLVAPALREQRADRAVDQARGERALLAGAALALEERAGDLARGVHPLLDVDGEREEVHVAQVACGGGGQDHRLARLDDDGTGGLLGHLAGFEGDLLARDLHGDARNGVRHIRTPFVSARRSAECISSLFCIRTAQS